MSIGFVVMLCVVIAVFVIGGKVKNNTLKLQELEEALAKE